MLIAVTAQHPIGDFGNYYYGSKFFIHGTDPLLIYKDLHFFNAQIRNYETGVFFENYTPVPPFSLLFYIPFLALSSWWAKLAFNLLGLLLLCFSLHRVIRTERAFSYWLYVVPLVFIQPLYANYHQGQAYVLIAALLLEFFMAFRRNDSLAQGLFVALLFSLKLFPGAIALFFLFNKNWRGLGWMALFSVVLQLLVMITAGKELLLHYYISIVPRLAMNEITAPFFYFNQSLHSFLLQVFIYEPYHNPLPFFPSVTLAVLIQWLAYVFLFMCLVTAAKSRKPALFFFLLLLVLQLMNKYCTTYGLLMLFPVVFTLKDMSGKKILPLLFVLFLACSIPVSKLEHAPVLVQYIRLWLLLAVLVLALRECVMVWDLKLLLAAIFIFAIPSFIFRKYSGDAGVKLYAARGVLYDFTINEQGLVLYSCLGWKDTSETRSMPVKTNGLPAYPLSAFSKEQIAGWQIKKSVQLNENCLLLLSDKNEAVGMYHLEFVNLKQLK